MHSTSPGDRFTDNGVVVDDTATSGRDSRHSRVTAVSRQTELARATKDR